MKTKSTTGQNHSDNAESNRKQLYSLFMIYVVSLIILFVLIAASLSAQQIKYPRIGFTGGMNVNCSGNGHGRTYMPYAGIASRKNELTAGLAVPKRTMKINGARLNYLHHLTVSCDDQADFRQVYNGSVQLSALAFVQYLHKCPLSEHMAWVEQHANPSEKINWYDARISTLETGFGMQLSVKLGAHVKWNNSIAGSVYYRTDYPAPMYFSRAAVVLNLGTALQWF